MQHMGNIWKNMGNNRFNDQLVNSSAPASAKTTKQHLATRKPAARHALATTTRHGETSNFMGKLPISWGNRGNLKFLGKPPISGHSRAIIL